MEQRAAYVGVVYSTQRIGNQRSIQLDGADKFGLIVHCDEHTELYGMHGEEITFDKLEVGMTVQIKHREAMTMSIPPHTYAYQVNVL
ncbi:hypothetical protein ACFP56_15630 [Paenibacillus septentrionalis]|uniref:Uncharacterized protein n=1 Tax=Paenibacillus septentrionalis TaxID=429342 RepID=A0ABW1V8Y2_9BACL